ncbi:hypothetical protein BJ508DRAFT_414531 [Ascobolus immersus RN42]|uniref:tRNA 4-demethylwyosine synthase (AdoMet-dependent) n=1 Tax=Ascobolus immersus RN42 TaxID=1160509 RepID=A0A3N4IC86_ASCIM|nr:hypothetical protein BJ508DRAFT_414531 [Ascobolus immersus RN42]
MSTATVQAISLWHTIRFPLIALLVLIFIVRWLSLKHRHIGIDESEASSVPKEKEKKKSTTINETKIASILAEKAAQTRLPSYPPSAISAVELGEQVATTRAAREEYTPYRRKQSGLTERVTASPLKLKPSPKRILGSKSMRRQQHSVGVDFDAVQPLIFFASRTASTAQFAETLAGSLFKEADSVYPTFAIPTPSNEADIAALNSRILPAKVLDLEEIELEDYFLSLPNVDGVRVKYVYILLLPSYDPPEESPCFAFLDYLEDTENDFRVDTGILTSLGGFTVFGFGDTSEWGNAKFCRDAIVADKWLGRLTGGVRGLDSRRIFPLGTGDVNPAAEISVEERLREWKGGVEEAVREFAWTGLLIGRRGAVESEDEDDTFEKGQVEAENMVDLEDLGKSKDVEALIEEDEVSGGENALLSIDFTTAGERALKANEPKEMVPNGGATYTALTKQGYTIVGSHSGVKLCRWTKSALRGRGSCYKFSFYGIRSHLCMETTPSLSCSNKCIFCWRHGTNPVGTSWRWRIDEPEDIFTGVVEGHYRKIKMMRGVPGIRADRFQEAFKIRHCALSLVGEPIFYPHINRFLHYLHASHISSFLVCNAQHPEQLAALDHVTQLYVSIDASDRASLKRIDRPLHRDFWERFQKCLDILREHRTRQRTVFRLTLVKGFNIDDEVTGYADLVERGLPCFVEVKGVTFCGTTTAAGAGLTMDNVPFWPEVQDFVERLSVELAKRGLVYGMAAEHAHSCCALLASEEFKNAKTGKWHTLIDYEKFFELLESGKEFGPLDYVGDATPDWAGWGKGGFNPEDERVFTKGKNRKKNQEAYHAAQKMEQGTREDGGGCG